MPIARGVVLVSLLCSSIAVAQESGPQKIAVMPLRMSRVDPSAVEILDELLVGEISARGAFQVIGASDINALLGLEKMKEAVGCDDLACAAEIGGALGVERLVAGNVGLLGGEIIITLKLINTKTNVVDSRAQVNCPNDESAWREAISRAAAMLFGTSTAVRKSDTSTVVADFSSPMFKRFELAKLDRTAYLDFVASGYSYGNWAERYNDESESWVLEISKWIMTGTTALILGVMLPLADSPGEAIGTTMPMAIFTGTTWIIDLINIGDAPRELPEL